MNASALKRRGRGAQAALSRNGLKMSWEQIAYLHEHYQTTDSIQVAAYGRALLVVDENSRYVLGKNNEVSIIRHTRNFRWEAYTFFSLKIQLLKQLLEIPQDSSQGVVCTQVETCFEFISYSKTPGGKTTAKHFLSVSA